MNMHVGGADAQRVQFKVGDRVLFTDKCPEYWWFGPHTAIKGGVIEGLEGFGYKWSVTADDGEKCAVNEEHIEPAPLTIREGGYYRTRDGRKVGPMRVAAANETWTDYAGREGAFVAECLEDTGTGGIYARDGVWLTSDSYQNSHDLVAEWQDEPATAASEPKFKVGDRVRVKGDPWREGHEGRAATIARIVDVYSPPAFTAVVDDTDGFDWFFDPDQLDAITTPAIVARIDSGQPLPARKPYVHASVADASKEATRLAKANPGREFAVYEIVHTVQHEYEHEWQRIADTEPYGGNAYAVLAEAAGISRKVALEAVKAYRSA